MLKGHPRTCCEGGHARLRRFGFQGEGLVISVMACRHMARLSASGVVVVALLATAGSALAAYPGANGRIAFDRTDGYIYSVRPDGTGLRRLGPGAFPAYSPDGKRIAFISAFNGGVWTMNANGTNRQRVGTVTSYQSAPTWSPNGKQLAFASSGPRLGIYALRSSSPYGIVKRIEATPPGNDSFGYFDLSPAWATNGLIYFTRDTADSEGFCQDVSDTMSVSPSTHVVREWKWFAEGADPAPRSRAMVYHYAWTDGGCDFADSISIANIDGTHPRAVTPLVVNVSQDVDPAFSPDATKVAFQRGDYVYTINANGTGLRRLTIGSAPSWQPLSAG
jgi:hypothetical protein